VSLVEADVAVNEKVKFAVDKRKLYVLDDEGKDHEMEIVTRILKRSNPLPSQKLVNVTDLGNNSCIDASRITICEKSGSLASRLRAGFPGTTINPMKSARVQTSRSNVPTENWSRPRLSGHNWLSPRKPRSMYLLSFFQLFSSRLPYQQLLVFGLT